MASSKGTVLITGASGFVGGHIAREALERGYDVRATARSDSSAKKIAAVLPQHASRISFAIVPDMTVVEAYEGQLAGVTAILHAASPFVTDPKDVVADLLDPAVEGTLSILEAARRYGDAGLLRRVVVTSSHAACLDTGLGLRPGHVYSEADWNPITRDEAVAAGGAVAYCASKKLAEEAAWAWMKEHGGDVGFDLATVNPPWVFGPYVKQPTSLRGLSESIEALRAGLLDSGGIPPPDFCGYADVREVADAHVSALEVPEAGGQRFWVGQNFNYQRAADAVREALPELRSRVAEGTPGQWEPMYTVDGSKAARVLGVKYRTLRETMKDTFLQLLEIERIAAAA